MMKLTPPVFTQSAGRRHWLALSAAAAVVGFMPRLAWSEDHSHHHVESGAKVVMADYTLPSLALVRDDGAPVRIPDELNDGRVVMLNFIFTTCTAICPVTSQIFSETQALLKAKGKLDKLHMVSISIDPENDTPARLREYAKRFSAGKQWQHYTGTTAASVSMQKAFDTYRGDKMNHQPVTLMRKAPGQRWVRVEGFVSPHELAEQALKLMGPG